MSDETDFAAFEAKANGGEPVEPVAPVEVEQPPEAVELPEEEAAELPDDEHDGEDGDEPEGKRRRSKPASQRIAELTARLREAERQLQQVAKPEQPAEQAEAPQRPDPNDFEFGDSDPAYIEALTDWKLESREAERAKAAEAQRGTQEIQAKLATGVAKAEEAAKAKYEDFEERIAEAVDARGGEPLPPLLTIGVAVSPVGGDILYRLATDDKTAMRLERLAKGGAATANAMAVALGELEGEYLDDLDDADLDMTDNLDMARMMGRMRARLKGQRTAPQAKPVAVTNAPEPPAQRARGGAGQFSANPATTDFQAFERLAMRN
jgi:hypothetical protein